MTPLMVVASEGKAEVVQLLLEHGADPALEDSLGRTAIDYAHFNGHDEIVEMLY